MSKVSTNISLDAETKAKAQVMLADLGLDLSTAVNIFLRQMLYEGGIPFSITREVPNKITLEAMKEAQEMDGDVTLAGQLVVWTTLISALSIFVVSFLLKAAGVF